MKADFQRAYTLYGIVFQHSFITKNFGYFMRTLNIVFLLALCLTPSVYAAGNLISLDQATSKVIQENNGKVLGARTESLEGRTIHIIKILTRDGRIQHIKVDAETGQVLK